LSESKSFGIGKVREATCVVCHGCGQMVRGRKALAAHKTECVPNKGAQPVPCTCFKGRDIRYNVDGTDVWPGHTYGLCEQHEGDAW